MSFDLGVDHDPVIICPYDRNHKIAKSRIQRHLVKCEKNFPPDFKKQCPYDATHRVFEQELVEHVKNCPMKHTCPIDLGQTRQVWTSEMALQQEDQVDDEGESWDEVLSYDSVARDPDGKESCDLSFNIPKSEIIAVKRCSRNLRRPFGSSESAMVETSSCASSTEVDGHSVTSDMGIGRGRSIPLSSRGTQVSVRGIRGRLLPKS